MCSSDLSGQTFTAVENFNAVSSIFTITPSVPGATHSVSGGVWNDVVSSTSSPAQTTTISLTNGNSMLGVIGLWDLSPGQNGSNIQITINFVGGGSQTLTQILGGTTGFASGNANTGNATSQFTFGFTSSQAFSSFTLSGAIPVGQEAFNLDGLQAVSPTAVPEPGTFGLVGLAMVGLGLLRRARR